MTGTERTLPAEEKAGIKELLAYHFPSSHYGRGVCGTHGMMATEPSLVTCDRCKKNAAFKAALNIAHRYGGRTR